MLTNTSICTYFKLIRAAKKLKNLCTVPESEKKTRTIWDLIRKIHGKPKVTRNVNEIIVNDKNLQNNKIL
jgi:hypothetical protein